MRVTRILAGLLTTLSAPAVAGSGIAQTPACENSYPDDLPYRLTIVSPTPAYYLTGDGKGYVHDRGACMDVTDDRRGFLHLAHPNAKYWADCRIIPYRSFTLDLSHPVAGGNGIDRGLLKHDRPHIQVFTRLDTEGKAVGLRGMAIGETTTAMYIAIAATGHQTRLYFNPSGRCPAWIKTAPGSTQGTVTRTSTTRWEIDIPEGSVGRLFQGPDGGTQRDLGLYRFRAHLTVEAL